MAVERVSIPVDLQGEVRLETYGEDFGQGSWITGAEAREWFDLLRLDGRQNALEVACGSGGITCAMAKYTGAACIGVDINVHGIAAAKEWAERQGLSSLGLVPGRRRIPTGVVFRR